MHVLTTLFRPGSRGFTAGVLGTAAALALAGCSKKATTSTGSSSSPTSSDAAITIMTANVPGVGTVLVNGNNRTLYELSSEQGGKITCTDANGCTAVWPDTELPSGKTAGIAGTGTQASLLSTVKSPDGKLYLTYNTFPLYTYTGDTGPGTAAGQGINTFGGTWSAITPAGTPATSTSGAPTSTASASAASFTVQTGQATVGAASEAVLTDSSGKTLYYRTSDTASTASCSGGCASVWPPLTAAGSPTGSAGVTGKLTVVAGANGSQVQYNGHFLYRFATDTAAGQAKGEGVGGFHVATPGLAVVAAAPAAQAPAAPAPAASTPAAATPTPAATHSATPTPTSPYKY